MPNGASRPAASECRWQSRQWTSSATRTVSSWSVADRQAPSRIDTHLADHMTHDLDAPDPPQWNTFTTVCPVQFVGESTVKALPVRLACPAMRVGDPVQVTEGGRIVTGTIATSMYGAVQVHRAVVCTRYRRTPVTSTDATRTGVFGSHRRSSASDVLTTGRGSCHSLPFQPRGRSRCRFRPRSLCFWRPGRFPPSRPSARTANGSSRLDNFGLGFRPTWLNGDLHRIFHWVFERHFDSEQSVLVGSFGFVRFHRPT